MSFFVRNCFKLQPFIASVVGITHTTQDFSVPLCCSGDQESAPPLYARGSSDRPPNKIPRISNELRIGRRPGLPEVIEEEDDDEKDEEETPLICPDEPPPRIQHIPPPRPPRPAPRIPRPQAPRLPEYPRIPRPEAPRLPEVPRIPRPQAPMLPECPRIPRPEAPRLPEYTRIQRSEAPRIPRPTAPNLPPAPNMPEMPEMPSLPSLPRLRRRPRPDILQNDDIDGTRPSRPSPPPQEKGDTVNPCSRRYPKVNHVPEGDPVEDESHEENSNGPMGEQDEDPEDPDAPVGVEVECGATFRRRKRVEGMRMMIASYMKNGNIPAMSVAVSVNGEEVLNEGFGCSDIEKQIEASADMRLNIASITKIFTAYLIMKEFEERRWTGGQLEENVAPDLLNMDDEHEFTLSQLLAHVADLRHYTNEENHNTEFHETLEDSWWSKYLYFNSTANNQVFVPDVTGEITHNKGELLYSSLGYDALGALLEINNNEIPYFELAGNELARLNLNNMYLHASEFVQFDKFGGYEITDRWEQTTSPECMLLVKLKRKLGLRTPNWLWDIKIKRVKGPKWYNSDFAEYSMKYASEGLVSTAGDLMKFGDMFGRMEQDMSNGGPLSKGLAKLMWCYRKGRPIEVTHRNLKLSKKLKCLGWQVNTSLHQVQRGNQPEKFRTEAYHSGSAFGAMAYLYVTTMKRYNYLEVTDFSFAQPQVFETPYPPSPPNHSQYHQPSRPSQNRSSYMGTPPASSSSNYRGVLTPPRNNPYLPSAPEQNLTTSPQSRDTSSTPLIPQLSRKEQSARRFKKLCEKFECRRPQQPAPEQPSSSYSRPQQRSHEQPSQPSSSSSRPQQRSHEQPSSSYSRPRSLVIWNPQPDPDGVGNDVGSDEEEEEQNISPRRKRRFIWKLQDGTKTPKLRWRQSSTTYVDDGNDDEQAEEEEEEGSNSSSSILLPRRSRNSSSYSKITLGEWWDTEEESQYVQVETVEKREPQPAVITVAYIANRGLSMDARDLGVRLTDYILLELEEQEEFNFAPASAPTTAGANIPSSHSPNRSSAVR